MISPKSKAERIELNQRIRDLGAIGMMSDKQAQETSIGVLRVIALMGDQGWYNVSQICRAAGGPNHYATEGLRRMRECRHVGYVIDRNRKTEGGTWFYRMRHQPEDQKESQPMKSRPIDWLRIEVEQLAKRISTARKSSKGINLHSKEVALASAIIDAARMLLTTDAINERLMEQDDDK